MKKSDFIGKMLLVDTVKGEVLTDEEIKETYAKQEPYGEWLDSIWLRCMS